MSIKAKDMTMAERKERVAQQGDFMENHPEQSKPKNKQAFFALAGKMHLDREAVTELREASC